MKTKTSIRYIGFRSTNDGGRNFDFCVSTIGTEDILTSCEIPAEFFTGMDRVRLQEGVGICYAKLKQIIESSDLSDVPSELCLTAADVSLYREVAPTPYKRSRPAPNAATN